MKDVKLNFAHLCDMAFLSQEGKANIIGIFKIIFASDFPTKHPKLSIITSLDFSDNVGKHKESIEIVRCSDSKKIGPEINFDFDVTEKDQEINFIADIANILFDNLGKYFVRISVDNNEIGKIVFNVAKISQQKNGNNKIEERI